MDFTMFDVTNTEHAIQTAKAAGFRVAGVYDPSSEENQEQIRSIADYYIRSYEDWFEREA